MDKNSISYEEQLEQLKEIVIMLRKDELPLSEALKLAENGKKQYDECEKMLSSIEEELEIFTKA